MFPAHHRPTRRTLAALTLVASLISIAPACHDQRRLISTTRSPPSPLIKGSGSVTQSGQFRFLLADELECEQVITKTWCTREKPSRPDRAKSTCAEEATKERTERLPSCAARIKTLTVEPPWGKPVSAPVGADGSAVFTIDWAMSNIDPLASDAAKAALKVWFITGAGVRNRVAWSPLNADIQAMLAAIGRASGVDITTDPDAKPAKVAIKSIEVGRRAVPAGQKNRINITVTLQNHGPGPAYHVIARTRSSHPTLHDLKLAFGRIDGGKEMSRTFSAPLPAAGNEEKPMIVVNVSGANVSEVHRSQRVTIRAAPRLPAASISLRCKLADQASGAAVVEAGKDAAIWCEVQNTGKVAIEQVKLTIKGPSRSTRATIKNAIAPDQPAGVEIQVPVPANAGIGSEVTIRVSATADKTSAETSIKAKVVLDRACPDGLLTRAHYDQKRAKLQNLLTQSLLAQEDFDRYDAELLRCLQ